MRNSVIWSFVSLVALATGGLITGCDSDEKLVRSALGESCDKTSDCSDGLRCLEGTCYKTSSGSGGTSNEGGAGNGTAGTLIGPKPPVLGGEGESCGKRADCEDDLGCFSGRCQAASGEGGASTGGPTLGGIGETCGLTSDCAKGLACLPQVDQQPPLPDVKAIGSNSVGVCTPTDNGLEPTGNVCGAECKTAEDCCELPVAVHVPYSVAAPYGTGANSCTQLAALLEGVNCATTTLAEAKVRCFSQAAYCDCGSKTWACNEAGSCEYTAACTAAIVGPVPGGCPSYTRTNLPLTATTCNKAKKCEPEASAGCAADEDCTELVAVAGSDTVDTCANGKCVCHVDSGLCYRPCSEDLDCPAQYTCDPDTSLCTAGAECDSDAFCVTKYDDIDSTCVEGKCTSSCQNDLDCNGGLVTRGVNTQVCNADHVCEPAGCTSDEECGPVRGVRAFCTKAPAAVAGTVLRSAVTD